MKARSHNCLVFVLVLSLAPAAASGEPKQDPVPARNKLTVAVLTFDANDPGNPAMGSDLSEMVTAVLSGDGNFQLVDRTALQRTLAENELNLTGLVNPDQAIQVGKLVGAKLLVTGRAFRLGKNNFITSKLVSTETSRVESVMVKGAGSDDLGEMAMLLTEKLVERLSTKGEMLTGADLVQPDPLPPLIAALAKQKDKPVFAVVVTEQHIAGPRLPRTLNIPDPAVETELKLLLKKAGYTIKDVPQNALAKWTPKDAWPRSLEGVDIVITGEALSEFGNRIGNLVSCAARAEINVVSRKEGKIVLAERATTRAVDLAENIAGKTALQKAGRTLAVPVFRYLTASQGQPK